MSNVQLLNTKLQKYRYKLSHATSAASRSTYEAKIHQYTKRLNQMGGVLEEEEHKEPQIPQNPQDPATSLLSSLELTLTNLKSNIEPTLNKHIELINDNNQRIHRDVQMKKATVAQQISTLNHHNDKITEISNDLATLMETINLLSQTA